MIFLAYQILIVFLFGAIVGSFCNVAIARMPYEKSLLWPGSTCGGCLKPIRWHHNLPLLSYLWLGGKCGTCGAVFSSRYFWIELVAALGFVGLFLAEVVFNIHQYPYGPRVWLQASHFYPWSWQMGFLFHAILFTFLLIASVCDLDGREIPFSLTMTGTVVGLLGATLLPWPHPWTPAAATPAPNVIHPWQSWIIPLNPLQAGIQPWPFWGPLPSWAEPGNNWQTGLMTGLAGALVGGMMLRAVRFLFSWGFGKEAMGLADADLMMMAGAFIGWQPVVVAFFVSILPGLVIGILQLFIRKDNSFPFGPSLALGVLITLLGWRWLGPMVQAFFFWPMMVLGLAGFMAIMLVFLSFLLRLRTQFLTQIPPSAPGGPGL